MSNKTGSASATATATATATTTAIPTKSKKPSVSIPTNSSMGKPGPSSSPSSANKRLPTSNKPQTNGVDAAATASNGTSRPSRRMPRVSTRLSTSEIPPVERKPTWTEEPHIITEEWVLKRYKDQLPSLIVHLHPTYFRFDQQTGSFSYQSPMKIFVEHLRAGTIPHDMMEELRLSNVRYYHGWLIVKIVDHKSTAVENTQVANDDDKPGSINNYNHFITPSPYAPYPTKDQAIKMERTSSTDKDKENQAPDSATATSANAATMPSASSSTTTKPKPKVFMRALRPTQMSLHTDLTLDFIAIDPKSKKTAKPATPAGTVPPTPSTERPPPLKKQKLKIDPKDHLEYEARIINGTAAPLYLEPADSEEHAQFIRSYLADPFCEQAPPSPKSRKRTHAELAADESHAKEQERFMLIMDAKTSASGSNNAAIEQNAANQPNFEQYLTLVKVKAEMEEKKRVEAEKRVQEDELRRSQQQQLLDEENRRKAQQAAIAQRKEQAIMQNQAKQQQLQVQRQQAENAAAAAAAQQGMQNPHPAQRRSTAGQPQPNGIPPNMQNQMVNAQVSPVIRQGTPNVVSSPAAPVPRSMARSASQSGAAASPPRPGSSLQHAHPNAGGMMRQPSAQGGPSRNGTPQVPHNTPGMPNATPVMRSGTPAQHMPQQSPMVNMATPQMPQATMPGQMVNGMQPQQQVTPQHVLAMQQRRAMQQMQAQANQMGGQITPQMMQQLNMQQHLRQQQAQQAQGTPQQQHISSNGGPGNQQAYNAQMRNMMQQQMRSGQGSPLPQNQMSPQQQQQMQQQVNMQAQQMMPNQMGQQTQGPRTAEASQIVNNNALMIFKQLMVNESTKYMGNPNMIPPAVKAQLQAEAQKRSLMNWQRMVRQRQMSMANGNMNGQGGQMTPQQMQQMQQQMQMGNMNNMNNMGNMTNMGNMNNMNNRMAMMQQNNNAQAQHQQQMQQQMQQMQNVEAMMRQQQGQQVSQDYLRLLQASQMQNQNRQG